MTFTPLITIYPEGDFNYPDIGDNGEKAILLMSKNLGYNKSLQRTRVNIHLGDEERIHTKGSIKSIWIRKKLDIPNEASDIDKVNLVLRIIFESLLSIGSLEGWDLQALEMAYHKSIADQGNFVWYSNLKFNKKRTFKARIKVLYSSNKIPIAAEFFDKKSNFQFDVPLIDTFLHFLDWDRVFSKPTWLDDERFGFNFLNSQLQIFANSQTRQSETVISEKNWTREQLEGQLRRLTFRKFVNDKEFVEWANK